ncbi:hypothetical protein NU195Hw_Modified_246t1 [Hortaea werneckii]
MAFRNDGGVQQSPMAPTPNFSNSSIPRRIGSPEERRPVLNPVQLAPVVLREATMPMKVQAAVSESLLDRASESIQATREAPQDPMYQQHRAGTQLSRMDCPTSYNQEAEFFVFASHAEHDRKPSARRPNMQPGSVRAELPPRSQITASLLSHGRDRHGALHCSSAPKSRLRRKRSLPSMRRPFIANEDTDVDQAIVELQAIVDKQRQAGEAPLEDSGKCALAPKMRLGARSKTLEDIGSAFARPRTAHGSVQGDSMLGVALRNERSSNSRASSRTRVSTWLSNLLPASSSNGRVTNNGLLHTHPVADQRQESDSVEDAPVSELGSTTTSEISTFGTRSQSHTADTNLTTISPVSTTEQPEFLAQLRRHGDLSSIDILSPSQVGLAF